jgi:diguanylate cyclase (GGDEF)-like protein/PAS domain S-box-containing protein
MAARRRHRNGPAAPAIDEQQARLTFDAAPIGIALVAPDGRFLQVNAALCRIVGYERDDLVGRTFQSITHPDDLDADVTDLQRCLAGEIDGYDMEKRYIHRAGHPVWVHLTVGVVRDAAGGATHFVAHIMDVTERRAAVAALSASEARFAAMVENGSDMIALTDPEGRLTYASPAYRKILGLDPEARLGSELLAGVHPDDQERVMTAGAALLGTPAASCRIEFRFAHGDGSWRWVEATLTNRVEDPAVGGFVINTRDVTERVLAAERLAHQATHDALTGLPNRTALDGRLLAADAATRRHGEVLAVVYVDVDHFKDVNDTYGHHVGDELLRQVAARLSSTVREDDTVVRLGGDEFVIVAEVADDAAAEVLAGRVCESFHTPFVVEGTPLRVSGSAGVATNANRAAPSTLLGASDGALYCAKALGRDNWQFAGRTRPSEAFEPVAD